MINLLVFIGSCIVIELFIFSYFISRDYKYSVKEQKKLTYLLPDAMILFSIIAWIILLIVIIYFLKVQGW